MQLPAPKSWEEFETICKDIWSLIWNDPNAQKNGRKGQPDHGVDIFGYPDGGKNVHGVQCKGKDNYLEKTLTKSQISIIIGEAEQFTPKIAELTIATTAPKDVKIQEYVRIIRQQRFDAEKFLLSVWFWEDIQEELIKHSELTDAHYSAVWPSIRAIANGVKEIEVKVEKHTEILVGIAASVTRTTNHTETIDHAKELLEKKMPTEALSLLERVKSQYWNELTAIEKYRLLTNIASAYYLVGKVTDASNLYIEAIQYNQDDEKALCNAALGNILLAQSDEANRLIDVALKKNPSNVVAHSLKLRLCSQKECDLQKLIAVVPECYRDAEEIIVELSNIAIMKNDTAEGIRLLESIVDRGTPASIEVRGILGLLCVQSALLNPVLCNGEQFPDNIKNIIVRGIELLLKAWNNIKDEGIKKANAVWLVWIGVGKKAIGNTIDGNEDIRHAYMIDSTNGYVKKQMALLYLDEGETQRAIDLLCQLKGNPEITEIELLLSGALLRVGKTNDAISVLEEYLRNPVCIMREEGAILLLSIQLKGKNVVAAAELAARLNAAEPDNIMYQIALAQIELANGDNKAARNITMRMFQNVSPRTPIEHLYECAKLCFFLEMYDMAANCYEQFVDSSINTELCKKYIYALCYSKQQKKALEILKAIRAKFGIQKNFANVEVYLYETTGDLKQAKGICEEYVRKYPNDYASMLQLARIHYRLGSLQALKAFTEQTFDIEVMNMEDGMRIASLCANQGAFKKAFEIAYEIRRKYFNQPDAHYGYLSLTTQCTGQQLDFLTHAVAGVDTVVVFEDEYAQRTTIVIENRANPDAYRGEEKGDSRLAKLFLGKNVGDEIILREGPVKPATGIIISIISKYINAHRESMSWLERHEPEVPWVRSKVEDEADLRSFISSVPDESRKMDRIIRLYKEWKIPIGTLSKMCAKNFVIVFMALAENKDYGVNCFAGEEAELLHAFQQLKHNIKVVICPISVIVLHRMGIQNDIIRALGGLGVAQAVLDEFREIRHELDKYQKDGYHTIGRSGAEICHDEIPSGAIQKTVALLEGIIDWITARCEILPCNTKLDLHGRKYDMINETMSPAFVDTLLIAQEYKTVLYSDDSVYRSIARGIFGVSGMWTQVVTANMRATNTLSEDAYRDVANKLAALQLKEAFVDATGLAGEPSD